MDNIEKRIAAEQDRSQEPASIPTDWCRSDRPAKRCHNNGGEGVRSVGDGSWSWRVEQGLGPRGVMRILLVEDDLDLAEFIRKGLKEERYAVDFAADGEEGLQLALTNPYDLLILDIMLPKLDGLTLCRRIRAKGNLTPVLLLTAQNTVETKISGFDTGADQFLPKPFAFAELLARIRALLRRGSPQPLVHLKAADLRLDQASRRVWRAGQEISLTNKEYALLEFLLRNKNRVLTRTAIIEHVWDISYDPMTNIVDAHIKALRAKIDRDFSPQLITTVRGAGYMLEETEPVT
jgi:DNA-binding response OmpR family regulator